jgi:hypothetical protein
MQTKSCVFSLILLFGIFSSFLPCNANPFEVDTLEIPAQATYQEETATDTPSADANLENERSLWKDLEKLYGTLGKRIGKRIIKNRPELEQENHLEGYDNLKISIDGDNYCGQFAMSTLLKGMGIEVDPQQVYQETNPAGIFTAPTIIVEHLRKSGIDARMKNKASTDDIAKRINDGKPVITLVDSGDGVPHWICITGYDTDENGEIVSFRMRDSYWGTRGPHTMDIKDFEKAWKSPMGNGPLSQLVGYSNVLIDNYGEVDPESTPIYPGDFSTATEDNMASGINDVVTGWKNKSVPDVIAGAGKLILGLPGAIHGVVSNLASSQSEKLIEWGKEQKEKGGTGNKILGEVAVAGGKLTNTIAKAGKVVGDIWSSGASMIGNSIKKLGSLFS